MAGLIDFKRIADAALGGAHALVSAWLPNGRTDGHEFRCGSIDGEAGDSFSVNLNTGVWCDFAGDDRDKGGDLVSLYAAIFFGRDQVRAAIALADELGIPEAVPDVVRQKHGAQAAPVPARAKPVLAVDNDAAEKKAASEWVPVHPVPDDAPEPPKAHAWRGVPQSVWRYLDAEGRLLGLVCRFVKSDGSKEVQPLSFCRHVETGACEWRWLAFAEPRPLYGLDRLAARPDAPVLVVEGEKCADAAHEHLPHCVVVSWPGGGKAVAKVDWSPLAGRDVMTWADADAKRVRLSRAEKDAGVAEGDKPLLPEEKQPGVMTMAKVRELLRGKALRLWNVRIPVPGEMPDGWDVADAIEAGLQGENLRIWVRERAVEDVPEGASTAETAGADAWRRGMLWKKGELADCLANVFDILAHREEWQGVLGFDEFSQRIAKLKAPPFPGGAVGEWSDADSANAAIWITRYERLASSSLRVYEAVTTLARRNSFHPVQDWLRSLPAHDGTKRLNFWLQTYLGVTDSPYTRRVARWFLVGMVARAFKPGGKFDTCLVLEGGQGKGKSTALSILGGEWFNDTDLDLQSKDAMISLQGVWLHEFAELGSLAKAESSKQKSFLTRRVDKFRPPHARTDIKLPRQTVFAGSVNDWEWQKDPTGGRRFWPVECSNDIDNAGLAEVRAQLFAEALAAFKAGERYWPTPDEQRTIFDPEQLKREQPDSLIDALHDWVEDRAKILCLRGDERDFSIATAVMDGLKMDASKLTRDIQTRVGIALRKLGCTRVEKRNGMIRYWYRPPVRNEASSEDQPKANSRAMSDEEVDDHVPF